MNPFSFFWRILDAVDAVAFAVCGLLAAALVMAGPLFLICRFLSEQRYLAACACAAVWLVFAAAAARDLWRRGVSWASGFLIVLWFAMALTFASHI